MDIIRGKAFYIGLLIGLLLFVAANIYNYDQMLEQGCCDCIVSFGLPFKLYETGGFFGETRILWDGLIADVLIAIPMSIGIGFICKRLFNTEPSHRRLRQNVF